MTDFFAKAPLVEIVAELRWDSAIAAQPSVGQAIPIHLMDGRADEFMMRFGGAAYQLGFQRSERLVPSGFPILLGQPVYRYRLHDDHHQPDLIRSALLQIGPGLFSANATPPYKSWDEFSPIVKGGVEALLKSRDVAEKSAPFSHVGLRYIDAFSLELMSGRDIETFIREILGFQVGLPKALQKLQRQGKESKAHIQLTIPVDEGMTMTVVVGEANFNGELATLMQTHVVSDGAVEPELEAVMKALSKARGLIHKSFVEMTTGIHTLMQLKQGA